MALVACTGEATSVQENGDAGKPEVPVPDAGPEEPVGCAPDPSTALVFDGEDDHVDLGMVPALGLEQLTIEAWVRRDAKGKTAGTGVGGIQFVPIVAKGRGESDGSNVDTNYGFGFVGDVIGADFEDMATGANHPVIGRTAIPYGEWHHVAVTYDGSKWQLFVDGRVDGEAVADAVPRADSIQKVAIGTTFNSSGTVSGAFAGAIDEVRIWDHARTADAIAASVYEPPAETTGLLAWWSFDEGAGDTAGDRIGGYDGVLSGPTHLVPGAPVGTGLPPSVTPVAPMDGTEVAGPLQSLELTIADDDSERFTVEYFTRRVTEAEDFTIVVLPDTQYYTVEGRDLERFFYDQTRWVMDNAEAYNIVAVLHNGDVVNTASQNYQWTIADRALSTLEAATSRSVDGMPFGISVGNHDQNPISTPGGTDIFNRWFGVERFAGRAYYGGHYRSANDESFITFSAGGLDFIAVSLQFDPSPSPAVLAWARQMLESHPDHFGIVNSHYIVTARGEFSAQGQAIYNALGGVRNLHLMTSGHVAAEQRRTDMTDGHPVTSMVADYQARDNGGGGTMRIWEFSPANDELTVRTYSPTPDVWETDANSEFTLSVDLSGAGQPFERVAEMEVTSTTASYALAGLEPETIYEWYAVVTDCAHVVRSPVGRFTTLP
jgi:hypothetical protein